MQQPAAAERSGERVLCVSFNQDRSLFALGTTFGFHVYNTAPLKRKYGRDWGSGVGIVEVYMRTNILALVGGGPASRFSPKKLTVWDDYQNRVIAEVDFYADIAAVQLRRDRIVVALPGAVDVLNFTDLTVVAHCPAAPAMGPRTLALSQTSAVPVLAFPVDRAAAAAAAPGPAFTTMAPVTATAPSSAGATNGSGNGLGNGSSGTTTTSSSTEGLLAVRRDLSSLAAAAGAAPAEVVPGAAAALPSSTASSTTTTMREMVVVPAHNGALACVALSEDGALAATASERGTLVRVWDTASGRLVKELRRGADGAHIWAMCFSRDKTLLAVSSSRGTCHIFGVSGVANKQSSLWSLRGVLPAYFGSEWSSMQVSVPAERSVLAFSDDRSSLYMVFLDGTYRRVELSWESPTPTARLDPAVGTVDLLHSIW